MNAKRSLESRIRGWFPKEPSLSKTPTNYAQINEIPTRTYTDGGNVFKYYLGRMMLFIVLNFSWMLFIRTQFPASISSQTLWLVSGLAISSTVSVLITKKQLDLVKKSGETRLTQLFQGIFLATGLALYGTMLFVDYYTTSPTVTKAGFASFVYVTFPIGIIARLIYIYRWEKSNCRRLLRTKEGKLYSIPEALMPKKRIQEVLAPYRWPVTAAVAGSMVGIFGLGLNSISGIPALAKPLISILSAVAALATALVIIKKMEKTKAATAA